MAPGAACSSPWPLGLHIWNPEMDQRPLPFPGVSQAVLTAGAVSTSRWGQEAVQFMRTAANVWV